MTMIERVAQALWNDFLSTDSAKREQAANGPFPSWNNLSDDERDPLVRAARAAIAAMREPTEGMVSAGNKSRPFNVVGYCEGTVHPVCQRSWPAMIDAALEEKP